MTYLTRIQDFPLDGVNQWVWPRNDRGLWLGPSQEWPRHKEKILELCTSFNTAVQAGGACGMYPKLMSKMFHKVYTFEPDHYNFYCLAQNCVEDNIYKFNSALGDRHRNVTFHPPTEDNRGVGVTTSPGNDNKPDWAGNVPVLRIDDFVYEKLDLIYLDIEGAEKSALYGAMNSIRLHKPVIVCENGHNGIFEMLKDYGYIVVDVVGSDTFFKCNSL
jgi:FkbM family methyltransferase